MELKEINDLLENINASLSQDITLDLNEKNLDAISSRLNSIVDKTDAKVFEMDEAELFKDIDADGKITDFPSYVESVKNNLKKFNKVAYYKSLTDGDIKERQNKAIAKQAKVDELINQIEKMGHMSKFIKEVEQRYNDKEMEDVFSKENEKDDRLYEKANEERLALEEFKNSSVVKTAFEQLRAIDNKAKKEKEIAKCVKEIGNKTNEIIKLTDSDLADAVEEELKELGDKKAGIETEIADIDKIINGKTVDDIKDDIRNAIPYNVDKVKIEKILNGSDIEKGFEELDQQYLTDMMKYENRNRVKEEKKQNLETGRKERAARTAAKPITFDPADPSLDLTDDEIKDIKDAIEKGGLDIDGLKAEDIAEYKRKAKADLFKPITATDKKERRRQEREKKREDRKNASQYLKEQNGKGSFKNMFNGLMARTKNVQKEYEEYAISKKMEELMILDKKQSNFQDKQTKAKEESKAKTAELDGLDNSFKAKVRAMARKMDKDDMETINKDGNYNEVKRTIYKDISNEEKDKADDEFLRG